MATSIIQKYQSFLILFHLLRLMLQLLLKLLQEVPLPLLIVATLDELEGLDPFLRYHSKQGEVPLPLEDGLDFLAFLHPAIALETLRSKAGFVQGEQVVAILQVLLYELQHSCQGIKVKSDGGDWLPATLIGKV